MRVMESGSKVQDRRASAKKAKEILHVCADKLASIAAQSRKTKLIIGRRGKPLIFGDLRSER